MPQLSRLGWLWAPLLAGCTAMGGYIGAQRDAESARTREIPPAQADRIPAGTLVYATPIGRETAKGLFRGVSDSAGVRRMRMDTGDGRESYALDSLASLLAQSRRHKYLARGLVIGAAIDIAVIGTAAFVAYEVISDIRTIQ